MTFQFKIQLKNITYPPVWRRLLVPGQFTFLRIHHTIQIAFGWQNYHLFQFSPKGFGSFPVITIPYPDDYLAYNEKPLDASKTKVSEILISPKQKYTYIYDFGDSWEHQIIIEEIIEEKLLRADCLDGRGACPPEDCGGVGGYENLKMIMNDPRDPEYKEMKEWLGLSSKQKWDAEAFDLEATRKKVRKV